MEDETVQRVAAQLMAERRLTAAELGRLSRHLLGGDS
jgi:hypothetical protein